MRETSCRKSSDFTRLLAIALLFGAAACSKCSKEGPAAGDGGGAGERSDQCQSSGVKLVTAKNVSVPGSPKFDAMKARGHVVVGVKADQPNLGYKDVSGKRCGFDVEMAQMISAGLGFDPATIEYKELPSANRESALKGNEIDYYVGSYSITDKRKKDVSFAGPYFVAGQDILVRKDDTSITGPETLKGKKVCSATGSTNIQRVRSEKLTEETNIIEFKTYSECVSQVLDKKADAVTTDDAILKGYAAQAPSKLRVVGKTFSVEKYGVGLPKDDQALRGFVNGVLQKSFDDGTWSTIYGGTLGKSGSPASPPPLERY